MEKRGHTFDHESKDHEVKPSPEKEKYPNYDRVSADNCTNRDDAEKNYASRSFSKENASTVVFDGNSVEGDISKPSSDGVASREDIYAKSDVSSDTGLHINMESRVDAGTVNGKQLNDGDICRNLIHGRKPMTESSCSNSTQVVRPMSSSNDSYQEISTEAKSSEHHTGGSSISFPTDFRCSMEEPVTSREVCGMGARITQKAVYNIRARDNMKISGIIRNQTPFLIEEENSSISCLQKQRIADGLSQVKTEHSELVEHALGTPRKGARTTAQNISIYDGAPGSSFLEKERDLRAINDSTVHFLSSHKLSCMTETKEEVQSCNAKDEGYSVCSRHIEDPEVSIKNAHSAMEGRSLELDPAMIYQLNGGCHGEESSESVMTIAEDVATKAQTSHPCGFDLNEDIHSNDFDCRKQLVCETGSYCSVIHVVAKSGVPLCIPITPLKFEGAQGWKGSAATSAFRPTLSKCSDRKASVSTNDHSSKHSKGFIGIDLNVVAEEDNAAHELHWGQTSSASLFEDNSLKVNSSRAERLSFDLNCLSDTTDECPQASLPVTSSKAPMVDFNLNEDPSTNTNIDVHQQFRSTQHMDRMTLVSSANSFPENSRDRDLSFARPVYWTDLSPLQFFGHTQARPLLVAAPNMLQPVEQMQKVVPLQPKLPYVVQTLPSHSYPSSGPFLIGPSESLSSGIHYPGVVPYARDPRVHTVFPQIMNHGTLPSFPGTPHLMQVVHVRNPTEVTSSDVLNGENLAVNGNMRNYTRQYLPPAKSSTAEEHVKPFHLAALGANQPMKRREPDGGWNSYQLGNRQFTSRN